MVSWGFAAARRINDSFSLGLAMSYLQVDLDLETTAYLPDDDTLEAFFSASSYLPERSPWRTSTRAHDSTVDLALGFLWRATERWRVGGFARSGFDVPTRWDGWPGPAASPDNLHYAFGFGAAFKQIQIDLGADFSDLRDTLSLSAIYSF